MSYRLETVNFLFGQVMKLFGKNKIGVMVSSSKTVEICEDKIEFSKFLQNSPIPQSKQS